MTVLRVAILGGAGFMGKAHSIAWSNVSLYTPTLEFTVRKALLAEVGEGRAAAAAEQFGWERSTTNWMDAVTDPDIDIIDICLPNFLHKEVALAAIANGKHVVCEKPLALTAEDAHEIWEAAQKAGVMHQVGFNWRMAPSVQLAKSLIVDGEIGEIIDFRGEWLSEWAVDPEVPLSWRFQKSVAGSGVIGDIGSHIIDYARFLVGEIASVCAVSRTVIEDRPLQSVDDLSSLGTAAAAERGVVDTDDVMAFMIEFESGAHGYIMLSRVSPGRGTFAGFEMHGRDGSLAFNWERMDELQFASRHDVPNQHGFRTIYPGPAQPLGEFFWTVPGYQVGYAETRVVAAIEFCRALVSGSGVQTTFEDGWRNVAVTDAVIESARTHTWVPVNYSGVKNL